MYELPKKMVSKYSKNFQGENCRVQNLYTPCNTVSHNSIYTALPISPKQQQLLMLHTPSSTLMALMPLATVAVVQQNTLTLLV